MTYLISNLGYHKVAFGDLHSISLYWKFTTATYADDSAILTTHVHIVIANLPMRVPWCVSNENIRKELTFKTVKKKSIHYERGI